MKKRVIALGFFDGLHLGHATLLDVAKRRAEALGARPAVLTFDTHPGQFTGREMAPLINSLAERTALIARLHAICDVLVVPFDEAFRRLPWDAFVEALQRDYGAVHVICGHNYYFGYGGAGDTLRLCAKCQALGMGVDVVPEVTMDGRTVSSTHIRSLLQAGEMEEARRFLGHPHTFVDTVRHGAQLGRGLSAPTINMRIPQGVLVPPRGVYATQVFLAGESDAYNSVTNIGYRPTVSADRELTVETHILDFEGDIYGQEVRLEFHHFLRPEMKFEGLSELKRQIQQDVSAVRAYFVSEVN